MNCGLCNVEVDDWGKHVKSKLHQDNLRNTGKVVDAVNESQAKIRGASELMMDGIDMEGKPLPGNCVCRYADKGKCKAPDEYLCAMEHDVKERLLAKVDELMTMKSLNNRASKRWRKEFEKLLEGWM